MTTKTTMTRTIRLAIGTAAVLALMSQAAQAKPLVEPHQGVPIHESASTLVRKGTYMPVSPTDTVAAAQQAVNTPRGAADTALARLGQPTSPTSVTVETRTHGFDWGAASIGAGIIAAFALICAAALSGGRRRVARSA